MRRVSGDTLASGTGAAGPIAPDIDRRRVPGSALRGPLSAGFRRAAMAVRAVGPAAPSPQRSRYR